MTDKGDSLKVRGAFVVGGAVAGALAMYGVLSGLGLLQRSQQDEVGIRVKNGSAFIETISADGFDRYNTIQFETKRQAKPCFVVEVQTSAVTGCSGTNPLIRVKELEFWTTDGGTDADVHVIRANGNKLRTQLTKDWDFNPTYSPKQVDHPDPSVTLLKMRARGRGTQRLECTLGPDPARDWIELTGSSQC